MKTKKKTIQDAKDEALTCFCMSCATCLEESEYNRVNYGGKRYVAMLTSKADIVVMKSHHTCSWCKHGLDIREATPRINKGKGGRYRTFYTCPTCQRQNKFKLYDSANSDVMGTTSNEYYVLEVEHDQRKV